MASSDHHALITRFASACHADTRIAAAFVGGSRGAGMADAHADSDLYLILYDAAYAAFFADRHRFMAQLGDPVFLEDFNGFGFDMLLFIYADGVEGELVLARASSFAHIPRGPFQPLLDRDGLLPDHAFPPLPPPTEAEHREHLRWLVYWFWRDLSQLSRWMARGRLWSAYAHLEMLRHTCLSLIRLKHAFVPALGSYDKLELAADPQDLEPFQRTFCRVEREAILDSVHSLLTIYLREAPPLAAAHGIVYPTVLQQVVLQRLEQACTVSFAAPALSEPGVSGDRGMANGTCPMP